MPSASLLYWQNHRMVRLREIDTQCTASLATTPSNLGLIDENLRGYALLLSAHFQGFCRDLYTESAQIIVSKIRASLQVLFQSQFVTKLRLDRGNPTLSNIREDFSRFGFSLDLPAADPANGTRISHLGSLNSWRNAAAHHGTIPSEHPLTLASVQTWRGSCDGLAESLDDIMYNQLRSLLRRKPW